MEINILKTAVQDPGDKLTIAQIKKQMPPCPICGKKAYLDHSIVDGFDWGWDVGCPVFCLDDGIHGISEPYDPRAPHVSSWSAGKAFDEWLTYCKQMEKQNDTDRTDS